jgi:FkbM family methyltransferase
MILDWLAQTHKYRSLVDIGANDGSFATYLQGVFGFEQVYAIEPLDRHAVPLAARGFEVLSLALSDANSESEMIVSEADAASSLMPPTARCLDEYPQAQTIAKQRVAVRRLDDVMGELAPETMIKVDAQGAEARIIRGGQRVFGQARAVLIEMTFAPLYEGGALFDEVHQELRKLGFSLRGQRGQHAAQNGEPLFAHCVYLR